MNDALTPVGGKSFEDLKQTNEHGAEYWTARDLQPLLGYDPWRRLDQAIWRAATACKQSVNRPVDHLAGAGKMVDRFFADAEAGDLGRCRCRFTDSLPARSRGALEYGPR